MKNYVQYLIAACKSSNSEANLKTVYSTFIHSEYTKDKMNKVLIGNLSNIVKFDMMDFYTGITDWLAFGSVKDNAFNYLVNAIAMTPTDVFKEKGYSLSALDIELLQYGYVKVKPYNYVNSIGNRIELDVNSIIFTSDSTIKIVHDIDSEEKLIKLICNSL